MATGVNPISSPPTTGGSLVLPSGAAWIIDDEGYVFRSDGTVSYIYRASGSWMIGDEGTYQTSGANITLDWDEWGNESGTYSVSGNVLTLTIGEPVC